MKSNSARPETLANERANERLPSRGLFWIFVGICLANYVYQAFGDADWRLATERTWFQGITLVMVWICNRFNGQNAPVDPTP